MGLKREITLLAGEKGLEDLYRMIDVHLVSIHCLNSLIEGVCRFDAHERLSDALLDAAKHPSNDYDKEA